MTAVATPAIERELDARQLRCPLPLLKAKQALHAMVAGQTLRVLATDPGSVRDFHSWCRQGGISLLSFAEHDHTFVYLLQKCRT
jgi:tRNA 2-thiouridine synthesizing protein A